MARTILIRVLLALALLGLAVGLYATHTSLSEARTQLHEQKTAIDDLRASQRRIQTAVTAVQKLSSRTKADLDLSLSQEPVYRDTPVPAVVADSLCKRIRCADRP